MGKGLRRRSVPGPARRRAWRECFAEQLADCWVGFDCDGHGRHRQLLGMGGEHVPEQAERRRLGQRRACQHGERPGRPVLLARRTAQVSGPGARDSSLTTRCSATRSGAATRSIPRARPRRGGFLDTGHAASGPPGRGAPLSRPGPECRPAAGPRRPRCLPRSSTLRRPRAAGPPHPGQVPGRRPTAPNTAPRAPAACSRTSPDDRTDCRHRRGRARPAGPPHAPPAPPAPARPAPAWPRPGNPELARERG